MSLLLDSNRAPSHPANCAACSACWLKPERSPRLPSVLPPIAPSTVASRQARSKRTHSSRPWQANSTLQVSCVCAELKVGSLRNWPLAKYYSTRSMRQCAIKARSWRSCSWPTMARWFQLQSALRAANKTPRRPLHAAIAQWAAKGTRSLHSGRLLRMPGTAHQYGHC